MIKTMNYGKFDHVRSIMATPVSGSARLVCVSHDGEDPKIVNIPKALASKILFCNIGTTAGRVPRSMYEERHVKEGNYVIVESPLSLPKHNNQPSKAALWDKDCTGRHPKPFSYFHGDNDRDKYYIYAQGTSKSISEAE